MWQNSIFLILDRIRVTINVLKKSDFCRNPNTEEGGILTNLKELQSKLRNNELISIDLLTIILPFTQILKSSNFAGPFKLSALETLQTFMKSNLFISPSSNNLNLSITDLEHQEHVLHSAISEMVEVVSTCKFIQTDNQGDELVQLQILKTLYFTVLYIPKFVLFDCCWRTLQFFLKTLSSTAGVRLSSTRQLLAQEAIQHSLRAMLPLLSSLDHHNEQYPLTVEQKLILQDNFREFLLYLANGMHKFTIASVKKASPDGNNSNSRPNTPVSANQAGAPSNLTNPAMEDQTILLFYLNLLHFMWINAQTNQILCHYFLTDEKISMIFNNEIFYCLINISSQWETLSLKPLQSILSIFTILLTTCPGVLRHVVEHFIHQVYIKSLIKYLEILNYQIGFTHPLKELLSITAISSLAGVTLPSNAGGGVDPNNFPPSPNRSSVKSVDSSAALNAPAPPPYLLNRTEILEMIFESLTDLISDDTLLPALFASFDCHPLAMDLVQPLVQLLTRATSIILTTGTEKLGSAKDLGIYIVQAYKQLIHSFSRRKQISDKWFDEHQKKANQNMITPQEVGQLNELFALARISKRLFLESSEKFLEKPTICFQFLQQEGLLPKPLTPSIAAIFLRQNTFLDKTAVGAFLGELGKDKNNNLKHECESVEFHQQLLQCYVKSFSFSSLSVLNSLRLFLSAFRLPGEAQQIDRILVAFSEYVHHHCYENRSEIIENPEITYLLSFSIIMLNTDRHNPNIRPEKKMTLDQFIKNNTNYGRDVNQTKPLPKEYLEEIYDSISKHPIRTTHGSEVFALVTDEEWMDVNMMLKTNPYYSLLLSSRQNPLFINQLLAKTLNQENDEVSDEIGEGGRAGGALSSNTSTRSDDSTTASMFERYAILKDLFTSPLGWYSTLHLSTLFEKIYGLDWLWDRDLLYATSPYLLLPGISVLIYNHIIVEETIYIEQTPDAPPINENHQLFEWKERTGRLMELSTDFLMEILSIASKHGLWKIIDMTTAILLQISGLKDTDIAQTYVKMMSLPNEYLFPPTTSGMIIESDPLQDDDVYPDHCYFIQRISYGTVQKSLLLLLNIIATYYSSMSNWSLLIYPLVILRDFTLLPSELVFLDAEQDNLLPSNVRQEFEFSLVSLDRQEQQQEAMLLAQEQQNLANQKKQAENTRSSFYALQLLGEALFGSSSSTAHSSGKGRYGSADEEDDTIEGTLIRIISDQYNLRSSRWDSGYEPSSNSSYHTTSGAATAPPSTPTAILGQRILQQQNNQRGSLTPRSPDQPFAKTVKWDVNSLRTSIEKTNILGFIAESKFLPDEHLVALLKTIIRTTEAYCSMEVASNSSATAVAAGAGVASGNLGSGKESDRNNNNNDVINDLVDHITLDLSSSSYHHQNVAISNPAYQNILPNTSNHSANSSPKAYAIHYYRNSEHFLDTMHFISNQRIQSYTSAASIAWLEMLLVEIVLRNRDRFHLCWPYLKYHYTRCLGNSFHKLSYITERQLSGLLKISARMLSRDNYGGVLIELLGRIFHPLFRLPPLSLTVTNATAAAAIATPVPPSNTMTSKKNMPLQKAANSNDLEDESHHANSTAALTHQNYLAAIDSLQGLSNQIAAGMWKLFTHNVDLLPMLSLEQWETLFKIVAFGSNAGSFAAFKSFEVMAWLLHEPRLIANVPVFCIIAVKPLVYNKQAPIFVSTGAVKLLKYLHSRLEAIIQDPHKGEGGNDTSASDTALKKEGSQDVMDYEDLLALDETSATVWKKCWLPILHALAEGVADDRVPVRESCAIALCEAINDRHAYAVPPGVLIDVFVHILCPVIRVLGDYLISDLHKQSLHAAINSSVNHLESLGLTAQIVTTAPGLPPPQARGRASSTGSGTGGKGKHDQDWVAVDPTPRPPKASSEEEITPELTSIPSTAPELSAIESHVIMRCIDTLTVVFMKHVRKLSHYPSFDKLWLQFLQLFSYFLEITPTSPPAPSTGAVISQPSAVSSAVGILFPPSNSAANEEYAILIQQLSNVCIQKLEVLIHCLQREKVFAKKEGLWLVTKEFLSQLSLPSSTNSSKNILRLLQESSST